VLWELFQTSRIEQSNRNAANAEASAREAQGDVGDLQRRVHVLEKQCERLTLAAMAMAEIVRDKLKLSEHEIEAKLAEIDLRDGRLDGQFRPPAASSSVTSCQDCHRPNGANRRQCLYCGTALLPGSFLFQSTDGPGKS
jgi:cytochrome c553